MKKREKILLVAAVALLAGALGAGSVIIAHYAINLFRSSEATPEAVASTVPAETVMPPITPTVILTAVPATPTEIPTLDLPDIPLAETIHFLGRGPIDQIELSPNGQSLAVTGKLFGYIYDASTLELLAQFDIEAEDGSRQVQDIEWSPNSEYLAVGLFSDRVLIVDAGTGEIQNRLDGEADTVTWSPDGEKVAGDRTVWDVSTGEVLHQVQGNSKRIVAWPDNEHFVTSDAMSVYHLGQNPALEDYFFDIPWILPYEKFGIIRETVDDEQVISLWSFEQSEKLYTLPDNFSRYYWHPSGTSFVAVDVDGREMQIFDALTGEPGRTFTLSEELAVQSIDFNVALRGSLLCVTDTSRSLFWNFETGELVREIDGGFISWLGAENRALIRQANGQYDSLDVLSGERYAVLGGHHDYYTHADWSPDGRWIVAGDRGNGLIDIWEVEKEEIVTRLTSESAPYGINGLAFSPDSRRLASLSLPHYVYIWDVETGDLLQKLEAEYIFYMPEIFFTGGLAWSPDGDQLFTGLYDQPLIWDLQAETYQRVPLPESIWFQPLMLAEFSDDGEYFICGNLWNSILYHNGDYVRQFEGVDDAQWTSEGELLLVSSINDETIIWNASSNREIVRLETESGRGILSHNQHHMALLANDHVELWNVDESRAVARADYNPGFYYDVISAAWALDDSAFVVPVEGMLLIWDVE
ncbi:MAG: WD40 repeat domain-containing protein [Anaerolineae bacterium]|nr:WD40 repeat domain-containing protein [Anaerolineae bacterium]